MLRMHFKGFFLCTFCKQCVQHVANLRYELQHSVGEQRPDGQPDEVREHFREVGFLGEGDEDETQEGGEVDDGNSQETITPYCGHIRG